MDGFTKLFGSILTSSIWTEDASTRLVWIAMLALKNGKHRVEASVPGLAHAARVSLEDCEKALAKLESPDPYSRSQEFEGRRVRREGGGWLVLNGERWMATMSNDATRERNRKWMKNYRDRVKSERPDGPRPGLTRPEAQFLKEAQ